MILNYLWFLCREAQKSVFNKFWQQIATLCLWEKINIDGLWVVVVADIKCW
jgi:hypothetical protein